MVPIKDLKKFDKTFCLVLDPILHISTTLVCDSKNKFYANLVPKWIWFYLPTHSPKLIFFVLGTSTLPPIKCDHLHQLHA